MSVTLSYDLQTEDANHRNYIRSMFERFHWERVGGSVLRYEKKGSEEDWLNDVVPSIMFFRSYILAHKIKVKYLTLDAASVARVDLSAKDRKLGKQPYIYPRLNPKPGNKQSSVKKLRDFLKSAVDAA